MAHDPRAPRLAAIATLVAGGLLVLSAGNLQLNLIGSSGISTEEIAAVLAATFAMIVAQFANKQREVPELGLSNQRSTFEDYGQTLTRTSTQASSEVNPTTASILTSILGNETTSDTRQVESAISTLSTGAFGASVIETMQAVETANEQNENMREAAPADEETGQTLQRVHVQPVPLPGREEQSTRDPSTIPGLEPNRVFVRDGVASVPLPGASPPPTNVDEGPSQPASVSSPETSGLPDLPDLDDLMVEPEVQAAPTIEAEVQQKPTVTASTLPDLDDLFLEEEQPTQPAYTVPELPDLDDLF